MSIAQFCDCKIAFSPVAEFDFLSVPEGQNQPNKILYNFRTLLYFWTEAKEQLESE